jgi:ribosomal protein L24
MQVIPKPGVRVKVLLGQHQGEVGTVVDILKDDFLVKIELQSGRTVSEEYEHVSKYSV